MIGLDSFKKHFKDFENAYAIIGGTACELLMEVNDLSFRATKDIDMMLIVESLSKEFGIIFWEYIKEANYHFINKESKEAHFYRFSHPKSLEYPLMIELFSIKQDWLPNDINQHIIPIHIDENISSLSAILLNEEYYELIKQGIEVIDGLSILRPEYILLLKARAWIDLTKRKENGELIDSRNIKKHKNDIFRLSVLLQREQKIKIPSNIKEDFAYFIKRMRQEEINLKQLNIFNINKNDLLDFLYEIYE